MLRIILGSTASDIPLIKQFLMTTIPSSIEFENRSDRLKGAVSLAIREAQNFSCRFRSWLRGQASSNHWRRMEARGLNDRRRTRGHQPRFQNSLLTRFAYRCSGSCSITEHDPLSGPQLELFGGGRNRWTRLILRNEQLRNSLTKLSAPTRYRGRGDQDVSQEGRKWHASPSSAILTTLSFSDGCRC